LIPKGSRPSSPEFADHAAETKVFGEPRPSDGTLARLGRNESPKDGGSGAQGSGRLAGLRKPYRFKRQGLGYSKSLEMHKLAIALHFGVYNFVRRHHSLGTTPALAAGLEEKLWSLEQIVEMTVAYWAK
jgi:hypothetical protein